LRKFGIQEPFVLIISKSLKEPVVFVKEAIIKKKTGYFIDGYLTFFQFF
jgi:hypothetical protein